MVSLKILELLHYFAYGEGEVKEMYVTNDWQPIIAKEIEKPYFQELLQFLDEQYRTATIYPKKEQILAALDMTAFHEVKVVLLGQDPYHGKGQAHGLSFSVQPGVKLPPSLRNMLKEMQAEYGYNLPDSGDLTSWAKQGVLLLNTVLTVREGQAGSHQKKGWETFTDTLIQALAKREQPIVFLLWGNHAQKKRALIGTQHIILEAPHPSPLSAHRGFFGSQPFSKANEALEKLGQAPIDWRLESEQTSLF